LRLIVSNMVYILQMWPSRFFDRICTYRGTNGENRLILRINLA